MLFEANTQAMLGHINFGSGADVSIFELAQMVEEVTEFGDPLRLDFVVHGERSQALLIILYCPMDCHSRACAPV